MKNTPEILLAEIGADVKYLVKTVDNLTIDFKTHLVDDDVRFKPLEDELQQRKGALKLGAALYSLAGGIVALVGSWLAGGIK